MIPAEIIKLESTAANLTARANRHESKKTDAEEDSPDMSVSRGGIGILPDVVSSRIMPHPKHVSPIEEFWELFNISEYSVSESHRQRCRRALSAGRPLERTKRIIALGWFAREASLLAHEWKVEEAFQLANWYLALPLKRRKGFSSCQIRGAKAQCLVMMGQREMAINYFLTRGFDSSAISPDQEFLHQGTTLFETLCLSQNEEAKAAWQTRREVVWEDFLTSYIRLNHNRPDPQTLYFLPRLVLQSRTLHRQHGRNPRSKRPEVGHLGFLLESGTWADWYGYLGRLHAEISRDERRA